MGTPEHSQRWSALASPSPEIAGLFAGLLPQTALLAYRSIAPAAAGDVPPAEWQLVASVSARRQADFLNGRVCAHAGLRALGLPEWIVDAPVGIGARGMPLWPQGVAGSIAHCDGFCAAVVGRKAGRHSGRHSGPNAGQGRDLRSLGLDIELRARMDLTYAGHILTPAEHGHFAAPDQAAPDHVIADPALRLALIFSAKEAFYKAQFPLSGQFLDFQAVSVDVTTTGFTVQLERPIAGIGDSGVRYAGRYAILQHHVLTGLIL